MIAGKTNGAQHNQSEYHPTDCFLIQTGSPFIQVFISPKVENTFYFY
jgi:hypothetical protein